MTEDFDIEIENIIEKKFRNLNLEAKILSFCLRRNHHCIRSLDNDLFTIEPFKIILSLVRKNNMIFPKDILISKVKKEVHENQLDVYEDYISKLYKVNLSHVNLKNIDKLISDLKEIHNSRRMVKLVNDEIIQKIDNFDPNDIKKKMKNIFLDTSNSNKKYRGELLEDFEERRQLILNKKSDPRNFMGVPTGIKEFDRVTKGGVMKSEFATVVGKTGTGKSIMLGNLAINAWKLGFNVLFVSLEMTKHQVQFRMDSRITKLLHEKFRGGTLTEQEIILWEQKIKKLRNKKKNFLEIICLPRGCCANDVEEEALRIQAKRDQKIDLLVIDYLNLMTSNDGKGNKRDWKYQADVAWDIKSLAAEYDDYGIAIWTANQMTDEGMKAKKTEVHHLKYARAISETFPIIVALNQSVDDYLQDIMKLWIIKCRDFGDIKKPILLRPKFDIMVLNQEVNNIKKNTLTGKI